MKGRPLGGFSIAALSCNIHNKSVYTLCSNRIDNSSISFYHGTSTPFTSILHSVKTTWGDAVFRKKYGTVSASTGSRISVAVTLEVVGGVIYWDEYYNGASGGEVSIGTTTLTQTATGDTTGTFSYTNSAASEPKTLELCDAILELAQQIQALRKE